MRLTVASIVYSVHPVLLYAGTGITLESGELRGSADPGFIRAGRAKSPSSGDAVPRVDNDGSGELELMSTELAVADLVNPRLIISSLTMSPCNDAPENIRSDE
jgi:hypothetical protein